MGRKTHENKVFLSAKMNPNFLFANNASDKEVASNLSETDQNVQDSEFLAE